MNAKFYGVDVSKDKLDIACDGKAVVIENTKKAITAFVKKMPPESYIALESTNMYHADIADICYVHNMHVYLVNPRITRRYCEVQGLRGSNDKMSALGLSRFIEREYDCLREYVPLSSDQRRLRILVRRRWKLVSVHTELSASLRSIKELGSEVKALLNKIDTTIAKIESLIDLHLQNNPGRSRIETIPGVGPVVSAVLVSDLDAHEFANADAFIAYYGLDPIPNDSGKHKGKRKLSKRGQRLGRAMLYNAAMAAVKTKIWKPIYEKCLERGLKKVQALVVIARRIARCSWSIYKYGTVFEPNRINAIAKKTV